MEPRILKIGEKVAGRYSEMEMAKNRKFFRVRLGRKSSTCPKTWETPYTRATRWAMKCSPSSANWMSTRSGQ